MRITGVEPARLLTLEPKSSASANSAISAEFLLYIKNRRVDIKKSDIKVNIADFKNEALMSIAKALNEGDKNGYDKIMMNDSSLYGRISAKMVYVYPPGIPILCPGEIISENVVNIISKAIDNGLEVVGLKDNLKDSRNDKNSKNEGCKGAFVCLK